MVRCGQDLNASGRIPVATCSESSGDATSFGEVKEFQPEGLINRFCYVHELCDILCCSHFVVP